MLSFIVRHSLRSLRRNAFYHLLHGVGLVIAMTSLFYVLVRINQELSYDRFHPDYERIYRFTVEFRRDSHHTHFARTWYSWTPAIPENFPEIESMARLQPMRNSRLKIGDRKFSNTRFFLADTVHFEFFGFNLLVGDPETVLSEPGSMVLSESIVRTFFGDEDPMGKTVQAMHQFDTSFQDFTVTGIMEDPPLNSHFKTDILAPIDYTLEDPGWAYIYFRLTEGADPDAVLKKFPDFLSSRMEEDVIPELTPHLQPVHDIHLRSDKDREIEHNNRIMYIYVFISVGLVFLVIVVVNNANLQMVMVKTRKRFLFINRVNGAGLNHVAGFFGFEAALVWFFSILISVLFIILSYPQLSRFLQYPIQVFSSSVILQLTGLALIVLILAVVVVIIPVYHFTARFSLNKLNSRNILVVIQFTVSVILVLLTVLIGRQIRFMTTSGIGGKDENIINLKDLPRPALDKYLIFKEFLLVNPLVMDVTATMDEPSSMLMDAMHFRMDGMDGSLEDQFIMVEPVDDNFLDFYGIRLLAGRDFPRYAGMEARENYIINETAMKMLGFDNPQDAVGTPFELLFSVEGIINGGTIVGVSEDFHHYTLAERIKPTAFFQKHIWFWNFQIRIDPANISEGIDFVEKTWDEIYPDYPFEYSFTDDLYKDLYGQEIRQARILAVISGLTILISCLGLLGLVRYLSAARTREIGIRRVNGAGIMNILLMLNRDFMWMILAALVLGIPASFFMVRYWLRNFVYRVELDWWVFGLVSLGFLLLTFSAVSYQSWRAASQNPAETLRCE